MSRFVLLRHDHPALHWDFMLEQSGVLRTWRLERIPGEADPNPPDAPQPAVALPDHRLAYLDYEGPVSGGRGTVRRMDAGRCDWLSDSPDEVLVRLSGHLLRGTARLIPDPAAKPATSPAAEPAASSARSEPVPEARWLFYWRVDDTTGLSGGGAAE